jgi:hypothetical protein
LLSPELAAGIRRVKGVRQIGVRFGNCVSAGAKIPKTPSEKSPPVT